LFSCPSLNLAPGATSRRHPSSLGVGVPGGATVLSQNIQQISPTSAAYYFIQDSLDDFRENILDAFISATIVPFTWLLRLRSMKPRVYGKKKGFEAAHIHDRYGHFTKFNLGISPPKLTDEANQHRKGNS